MQRPLFDGHFICDGCPHLANHRTVGSAGLLVQSERASHLKKRYRILLLDIPRPRPKGQLTT
jgi:hypothetical protein